MRQKQSLPAMSYTGKIQGRYNLCEIMDTALKHNDLRFNEILPLNPSWAETYCV